MFQGYELFDWCPGDRYITSFTAKFDSQGNQAAYRISKLNLVFSLM